MHGVCLLSASIIYYLLHYLLYSVGKETASINYALLQNCVYRTHLKKNGIAPCAENALQALSPESGMGKGANSVSSPTFAGVCLEKLTADDPSMYQSKLPLVKTPCTPKHPEALTARAGASREPRFPRGLSLFPRERLGAAEAARRPLPPPFRKDGAGAPSFRAAHVRKLRHSAR